MRILITRPRDDAVALAAKLKRMGHTAHVAPLMEVTFIEGPPLGLKGVQGILATSANGVRAFSRRSKVRDLPVYAVGPQTAEAASRAGFDLVFSAEGDAQALAEAVASWTKPEKGALLHAAGMETAGRLRKALQAKGFAVTVETLYEAAPVETLPETARSALEKNKLDGVMLFSPRSAKLFAKLVTEAGLADACARLSCFCISAATAAELGGLSFARVAVAGAPDQDAILALLSASENQAKPQVS
ncbi:MAG: uroporphyrinogen-III synthase [Alphaproteobacteria bacterium]